MMSNPSEHNQSLLTTLNQICQMTANQTPLETILRRIAQAARELTDADLGLSIVLRPPPQPAAFFGCDRARSIGQPLLQHLKEMQAAIDTRPMQTLFELDNPAANALHTWAQPIIQGKRLRGYLTTLYQDPPADSSESILALLGQHAAIAIEKSRLDTIVSQSYAGTIQALASAIDARDPSTHRHQEAVTRYAVRLAEEIGLEEEEVNTIRYAAMLHDIGKIGIKEEILSKPGSLTPTERAVVEAHTLVGTAILSGIPFMKDLIPLIRDHHERMDGSGYPAGLRGDEIPLGARILAIADAFDAMTTQRPYHRAMSISEACAILEKESGRLFDADLVRAFVRVINQLAALPNFIN
jgi:putative nucleotidyltransferase with HDIG domain